MFKYQLLCFLTIGTYLENSGAIGLALTVVISEAFP